MTTETNRFGRHTMIGAKPKQKLSTGRGWSFILPLSGRGICIYRDGEATSVNIFLSSLPNQSNAREGEAPAELGGASSAGASLSQMKNRRVDFSLPLVLASLLFLLGNQSLRSAPPEIVCSVSEEEIFIGESLTEHTISGGADRSD